MANLEQTAKKMYNAHGARYQQTRDEKRPERAYNEFYELPAMLKTVGNIRRKKILDIGCGAGVHAKRYANKGAHVSGIDISETMISLARKRCPKIDFHVTSITKLPYKDNSFDIVTASLIMDYVENWPKALKEVRRVLKPQGSFLYSFETDVSRSREFVKNNALSARAVGYVEDAQTKKRVFLGNYWLEGQVTWTMVPGMPTTHYQRMFSSQLHLLRAAGFELIDIVDCVPTAMFKKVNPTNYAMVKKFPLFAIYKWKLSAKS